MSIRKSGLDLVVLPAGLLSSAKSHLRVDGTWDDHAISTTIARAIAWFERVTGVCVNPVTVVWKPAQREFDWVNGCAPVPVSPVNSWTAAIEGDDVTSAYEIGTDSMFGVEINTLVGSWASGLTVTIPSGTASAAALDPGISDIVLRYTAHLYEHREILVAGTEAQTPGWMLDVTSQYWKPRI